MQVSSAGEYMISSIPNQAGPPNIEHQKMEVTRKSSYIMDEENSANKGSLSNVKIVVFD